jgi:general secretion pathway protein B
MSSILEALRKLEDEKTARRSGSGSIAGRVTYAGRRPGRKPAWLIPVLTAAVAVVLTVLITYAVMGGFSARRHEAVPAAGVTPAQTPPVVLPPSRSAGPVETTVIPARPRPAPEVRQVIPTASPTAAPSPSPARSLPAAPVTGFVPLPVPAQGNAVPLQSAPAEQLPLITVSGIAWQKDNSARLAVVNGVTVAEGGTVEGARVQKILPDRVRFSFNKREFDIYLTK